MKLQLQPSLSSRQDLSAVAMEIKKYSQWLSSSAIKQKVAGWPPASQPDISDDALQLINSWLAGQPASQANLDELTKALSDLLVKAKFVNVTLAAAPSSQQKQAIVAWFRQNVRPDILVDFNFNSTMLGGMMVRYGSRVFDGSFKRQIMANRLKFPEVLRSV